MNGSSVQDQSYLLQGALVLVKGTRNRLASSQAEIGEHMAIASQQRQKQALAKMEETLLKVNRAAALRDQLKCESSCLLPLSSRSESVTPQCQQVSFFASSVRRRMRSR